MSVLRRKRPRPQDDVEHQIRDEPAAILPILRIEECSPAIFIQGIETRLKLRVSEMRAELVTEETAR